MPHPPTGILLGGVAGCPPPAAIAEQLHAQQGSGAGRAVPAAGGRRRPVGRRRMQVAPQAVTGRHPGEGGVTAATGDTHRFASAGQVGHDTPNGDSTEVPNLPSHRPGSGSSRSRRCWTSPTTARPHPGVGVDHDGIGGQHMSHSGGLRHGGHHRHTEQPTAGRVIGQAQVLDSVAGRQRQLHAFPIQGV